MSQEKDSDNSQESPPSVLPIRWLGLEGEAGKLLDQDALKILPHDWKKEPEVFRVHAIPKSQIPALRERIRRDPEDLRERVAAKKRRLKVKVDSDNSAITLDGVTYAVKYEFALFVDALLKAGTWVSGPDLKKQSEEFFGRPDRIRNLVLKAIPPLVPFIETSHKGYRLKSEMLE